MSREITVRARTSLFDAARRPACALCFIGGTGLLRTPANGSIARGMNRVSPRQPYMVQVMPCAMWGNTGIHTIRMGAGL